MFKEDTYIEVYTEFDNNFYLPTMVKNGIGYKVMAVGYDGETNPTYIPWSDIKYINRVSSVFKTAKVRFGEEFEEEVYKELKINVNKENKYYTRAVIEDMIINSTDEYIKEIINIKDLGTIQSFVSILTALENTNEYNISNKMAIYIRARYDELVDGVKESELTVVPSKNTLLRTLSEENNDEESDNEENDEVKEDKDPEPKPSTRKGTSAKGKGTGAKKSPKTK